MREKSTNRRSNYSAYIHPVIKTTVVQTKCPKPTNTACSGTTLFNTTLLPPVSRIFRRVACKHTLTPEGPRGSQVCRMHQQCLLLQTPRIIQDDQAQTSQPGSRAHSLCERPDRVEQTPTPCRNHFESTRLTGPRHGSDYVPDYGFMYSRGSPQRKFLADVDGCHSNCHTHYHEEVARNFGLLGQKRMLHIQE